MRYFTSCSCWKTALLELARLQKLLYFAGAVVYIVDGDEPFLELLGGEPLFAGHLGLCHNMVVEVVYAEQEDGLLVDADLPARHHVENLVEGAEAAGQRNEQVAFVHHHVFPFHHVVGHDNLVGLFAGQPVVVHELGHDAHHGAPVFVDGGSRRLHETLPCAPIIYGVAVFANPFAQFGGLLVIDWGQVVASRAEDAYVCHCVNSLLMSYPNIPKSFVISQQSGKTGGLLQKKTPRGGLLRNYSFFRG